MSLLLPRIAQLPKNHSFFLFGARNTGKSTLIKSLFTPDTTLYIDLLDSEVELNFLRKPNDFYQLVRQLPDSTTHVVIDEVQKVPALLDVVHRLMGETRKYFVLTGSSARKLKRGGANLLAGRAFLYHLFPLTFCELGEKFSLDAVLQWGSLPSVVFAQNDELRKEFLYAYAHSYLKEEVWSEQFVRELDPFRRFLEVAAQMNGKVINFSKIGEDVGVSRSAVQTYYSILEDTLLGTFLGPYHGSFRKRLGKQPKFYFFDTGVTRVLAFLTDVKLVPQTNAYGNAFEHFIILECIRLSDYYRLHYRFSYVRTQDGFEIDLMVDRPGKKLLCIEIKSAQQVDESDIRSFIRLSADIPNSEAICISNEKYAKKIKHVIVMPWRQALEEYFTINH